ncbi:ROK family protein [Curtobacterium flaccumfaciens]|nr:ROK family protein [Curtobacterium flaccumfaciens]
MSTTAPQSTEPVTTAPVTAGLALAVDLGGTKVEAALVTDEGVVLPATRFRSPTGPQRTSDELQAAVDEVVTAALAALPADATLVGVGIGSAGPVDEEHGLVSPSTCRSGAATRCATGSPRTCPTVFPSPSAWTGSRSPSPSTGSARRRARTTSWA